MSGRTEDWARSALLANMRQDLMAPVTALLGYAEMLLEEALKTGPETLIHDFDRIYASARLLSDLSWVLLDPDRSADLPGGDDPEAAQATIRHDLRTPLSAVKGYTEMLIEDAAFLGIEAMVPDLERMLDESSRLLDQLETLIDFSRDAEQTSAQDRERLVAPLEAFIRSPSSATCRKALPGRILVVDDNESNRDLLARRLRKEGQRADIAEDGQMALDMTGMHAYDLILLDMMMPGISGYEVLTRLKAQPATAGIPVIMISAFNEMESVVRCLEAGADDFLPKPINTTMLSARIDASLERKQARDRERKYLQQIEEEKRKSEALLLNILPAGVVRRMHAGERRIADRFDDVSILFADLVGFTAISAKVSAQELVDDLNRLFFELDAATTRLRLEKIKTIGDAYMVAGGLPAYRADHAAACVELGQEMLAAVARFSKDAGRDFAMRIGVHSGPVVAGVIGSHKFAYDVWGDTVNVASRMESHGIPGRIHLSVETARRLGDRFALERRGMVNIKGKGEMETFLVSEGSPGTRGR